MKKTKKRSTMPLPDEREIWQLIHFDRDQYKLRDAYQQRGDFMALRAMVFSSHNENRPLPGWAGDAVLKILDALIRGENLNKPGAAGAPGAQVANDFMHYRRYAVVQGWRGFDGVSLERACLLAARMFKKEPQFSGDPRAMRRSYDLVRRNLKKNPDYYFTSVMRGRPDIDVNEAHIPGNENWE